MNAASLESPRLRRTLRVLKRRKRSSTLDLVRLAGVCAVNSIIAELRQNGYNVKCQREGAVWWYSLA
jgi:hypothetical protein